MSMKVKFKLIAIVFAFLMIFSLSANSLVVSANEISLYLGGNAYGFNLKTRGAVVVGTCDVLTNKGMASPSKQSGIMVGDTILSMNGKEVNSASDFASVLNDYNGGVIVTEILRNNVKKLVDLIPEKDINDNYKMGVFLREDLAGIGTLTFIKDDGTFGALGHPVSNNDGSILEIKSGSIFNCSIIGLQKAVRGKAGELKGMFIGESEIGCIYKNSKCGIFGKFCDINYKNCKKVNVAKACIGKAQIVSTIDGQTPKIYDIEIVKTDNRFANNKNLVIKITDEELLTETGGILQGMSGSPILQKGNLVGAVTHVFINDSSRGYGISIQNMLNEI